MKILFPYMARWNSANASRYFHLLNAVANKGHQVIVIQPPSLNLNETNFIDMNLQSSANIQLITSEIPPWLWNIRLPKEKLFKKMLYTIYTLPLIQKLKKVHSPDLLLIYNIPQYAYLLFSDIPVVFDYADDYLEMLKEEMKISQKHPFYHVGKYILNRIIQNAILVTCISKFLSEKISNKKVVILSNGASAPGGLSKNNRKENLDIEFPTVCFLGAFEYFIDFDVILSSAADLPRVNFILIGAGRQYTKVHADIVKRQLKNVKLTGALPHDEAMHIISASDMCLNIFKKCDISDAASPLKLFEYIAAEKPVISTRLVEVLSIDKDGSLFFYADTSRELTEQILRVLDNSDNIHNAVKNSKQKLLTEFTWEIIAEKFIKMTSQAIK